MGKSRPRSISVSANQIHEFGSSQSLWDRAYNNSRYNMLRFFYCYGSFQRTVEKTIFGSRNVTAAMLVWRTILIKVLREFEYTIMQNLSDILPLFCTPTWPSHHQCENPEYPTNYNRRKLRDQPIRISSNYLKLAQSTGRGAKCFWSAFLRLLLSQSQWRNYFW